MPSLALHAWRGERRYRLDDLLGAHRLMVGAGRGHRYGVEQLDLALILRLAAEFQGLCRDLHSEGAAFLSAQASAWRPDVANMLKRLLDERRALDTGNAHVDSLAWDFGRFSLLLWDELQAKDRRTTNRKRALEQLNLARNGISHDDQRKLQRLAIQGVRLDLATFRRWRRALDGLAGTMDQVLRLHLASMLGVEPPW